jgi:hypothetical protein
MLYVILTNQAKLEVTSLNNVLKVPVSNLVGITFSSSEYRQV